MGSVEGSDFGWFLGLVDQDPLSAYIYASTISNMSIQIENLIFHGGSQN